MSGILSMLSGGTYSTKPDAPTIGTATATSTTTATVAFTAPAKDGGATITSYTATSSPGGVTGTLTQAGSGTITVSGLTTGTAYTFTVTATNSVGTSDASAASNSITTYLAPANTVAPVVSGTATRGQTLSTTNGTWNGIPTPTFGYQWQRAGSNIGGATSSTYTLVSADVGNTIRCVVTATNVVSVVSANSNATAAVAAVVPGAPTSVSATATGSTTATVSFTAPADNGGATITNYVVSGGGTGSGSSSPISVSGLSGATSYTFTVTATNSAGTGPSGSAGAITTPEAPPTVIGQSFGGGFYAGKISTAANGTATHYLIVSPRSTGESPANYKNGVASTSTGQTGTINGPGISAYLASLGAAYEMAVWCENLSIGGYTDWYMPAYHETVVLYYNLKPDTGANTTGAAFAGGYNTGANYGANPYAVSPEPTSGWNSSSDPGQTSATAFRNGGGQQLGWAMRSCSESTRTPTGTFDLGNTGDGVFTNISKDYTANNITTRAVRRVAV